MSKKELSRYGVIEKTEVKGMSQREGPVERVIDFMLQFVRKKL